MVVDIRNLTRLFGDLIAVERARQTAPRWAEGETCRQLLRDQAVRDKDRTDLARYQLLAEQNSIARQQAEDQAYIVNQDEATVKLDQALVEGAKLNLNYGDIVSPVDRTVVSRNVTGGQTVAASFRVVRFLMMGAIDFTGAGFFGF